VVKSARIQMLINHDLSEVKETMCCPCCHVLCKVCCPCCHVLCKVYFVFTSTPNRTEHKIL